MKVDNKHKLWLLEKINMEFDSKKVDLMIKVESLQTFMQYNIHCLENSNFGLI